MNELDLVWAMLIAQGKLKKANSRDILIFLGIFPRAERINKLFPPLAHWILANELEKPPESAIFPWLAVEHTNSICICITAYYTYEEQKEILEALAFQHARIPQFRA